MSAHDRHPDCLTRPDCEHPTHVSDINGTIRAPFSPKYLAHAHLFNAITRDKVGLIFSDRLRLTNHILDELDAWGFEIRPKSDAADPQERGEA